MSRSSLSSTPDPLPLRWAVILLSAAVMGLVVGALAFVGTGDWAAALLAAVGAGGAAVPALHGILGR